MAVTTRRENRYPVGATAPPDVPAWMLNLATDLDDVALHGQGTLAGRPAVDATPGHNIGVSGSIYTATDTVQAFLSTGTSWLEFLLNKDASILSRHLKPTAGVALATADIVMSTADLDITGASISVTPSVPSTIFVFAFIVATVGYPGDYLTFWLNIDGSDATKTSSAGPRTEMSDAGSTQNSSSFVQAINLTAAAHTIKLRADSTQMGLSEVWRWGTGLAYLMISQ